MANILVSKGKKYKRQTSHAKGPSSVVFCFIQWSQINIKNELQKGEKIWYYPLFIFSLQLF